MDRVGLIGRGFVGNSLYESFKHHFDMQVFDLDSSKSTSESVRNIAKDCKVIFTALPTPKNEDGSINLYAIEKTLNELNILNIKNIVVIKSSVPPGKTSKLQDKYSNLSLVFNPEFLTERNAVEDFKNQTKVILGGINSSDVDYVKNIYQIVFPDATIHTTDSTSAEMVKFIINCFLSTKVSFFNEMYQVCNKLNIDYDNVIKLSLLDPRIGESHTAVPGWDGHFGFGGSCFPANVNIMMDEMKKLGIDPSVLKAVWNKNMEVRPEKDWELLEGRCVTKKS